MKTESRMHTLMAEQSFYSVGTIRQSAYQPLYEGQTEKHREVRIQGPVLKLSGGILSHLTLKLKNKCSKFKHLDPFLNEQLLEKRSNTFPMLKVWGHGCFHKSFCLYCKMRNGMRNLGRKSEKHQTKTFSFFSE